MPIDVRCGCGRSFAAKEEHAGKRARCSSCGAVVEIPRAGQPSPAAADLVAAVDDPGAIEEIRSLLARAVRTLGEIASASPAAPASAPAASTMPGPRQYKVLTQKDKWFSGKFDPERLEQAINAYAAQGWSVRGITTASIPGFGGNREELIVLLER